jgi:hypothetical protein
VHVGTTSGRFDIGVKGMSTMDSSNTGKTDSEARGRAAPSGRVVAEQAGSAHGRAGKRTTMSTAHDGGR